VEQEGTLSRYLTGRRSFSRDPSKSDKMAHWVDQATPLQLAGRYTYPPNQNIWRFWAVTADCTLPFLPARRTRKRGTCYGNVAGWVAGCLQHTGIVSTRINLSLNFFDLLVALSF